MPSVKFVIGNTSCPTCGQDASIVLRTAVDPRGGQGLSRQFMECYECILRRETPLGRLFSIRKWRLSWMQAGGTTDALPDCLRMPDDPPRPKPAPAALPRLDIPRRGTTARRGADSPNWKSPAKFLAVDPIKSTVPRVLFVSHDLSATGAPRWLLYTLPHLRQLRPTVHALAGGPLAGLFVESSVPTSKDGDLAGYDLVVVNTTASVAAARKCAEMSLRWLWVVHEWEPTQFVSEAEMQRLADSAAKVVFVHQAQRDRYPFLPREKVRVLPAVIQPPVPRDRAACRAKLGYADADFVALTFGLAEARKGQSDIREALIDSGIRVAYISGQPDVRDYLSAADVYVSSSREECYPLSLQEARAHGLPIVATDIPCHREMITEGVSGLLYERGDSEQLREHLERLRSDDSLRAAIGSTPLNVPSWAATIAKWEALFLAEAGGGCSDEEAPNVVYHICGMGDLWPQIVTEQLTLLRDHGLRKVYATHCGEGLDRVREEAKRLGVELLVMSHSDSILVYERPGIELVETLAAASDKPILYLHSKGVSHPPTDTWYADWRRLMQEELVPNWRQHVAALQNYDAVGVDWWTAVDKWHFSGNFWLATAAWIRKLPKVSSYWRDRFSAERWIGATPGCRAKSLLCTDAAFWDRDRAMLPELRNQQILRRSKAAAAVQ